MNKIILMSLCLASCRYVKQVEAVDLCGTECLPGQFGGEDFGMTWQNSVRGECRRGTVVCPDDGGTQYCSDYVAPTTEVCDGLDNDCDGQTDELSKCCTNPTPEVCDGIDNDCDGIVDNVPATEFCYTADIATAGKGICHPGVISCINGKMICANEVTPQPEVCNGLDDNCDGQVDENMYRRDPIDFVFVIDNSGSMDDKILSLSTAINQFVDTYSSRLDVRWAVVEAPGNRTSLDGEVVLKQNLGNTKDFKTAMSQETAIGGGLEPTIDAVAYLCDPANPMKMTWAPGSKKYIVMLSDEIPQSYGIPANTTSAAAALCASQKIVVLAFTEPYPDIGWTDLTSMPGGKVWPIDSSSISLNLKPTIESLVCN